MAGKNAKISIVLCFLGITILIAFLLYRDKKTEEQIGVWSKGLYKEHEDLIDNIDIMRDKTHILSGNDWDLEEGDYFTYLEASCFNPLFYENGNHEETGILTAQINEGGVAAMRVAVYDAYEWAEYEYLNTNDYVYFTICGQEQGADMPYYWFSSGSFNCSRLQSEWSEDDFVKLKEISALNQKYVKNEYLVLENHLYALDREKRKLADVTDSSIQFGGEWLAKTAEKVFWDSKVTPEAIETVCNLEPVAYYIWSDRFSKLAVCDINKDGTDDYVAVLVEQKRSKLAGEEIPSSECICLYLSERNGEYQKEVLDSGWNHTINLFFESDGLLYRECLMYNIRNYDRDYEPLRSKELVVSEWFRFDVEAKEFLFCGRADSDFRSNYLYISEGENEEYTLKEYCDRRWSWYYYNSDKNIYRTMTAGGQDLKIEYENILSDIDYTCVDETLLEILHCAKTFAEDIFDREKLMESGSKEVFTHVTYQNEGIVSGYIELEDIFGWERKKRFIIDRKSGKIMYIQSMIDLDEMLDILEKGMKDSWNSQVDKESVDRYLSLLEKGYGNANSLKAEGTQEDVGVSVDFEMSEWGLKAYIQINAESGETEQEILYLDKEFLIDTSLWEYWKYNKN